MQVAQSLETGAPYAFGCDQELVAGNGDGEAREGAVFKRDSDLVLDAQELSRESGRACC